MRKHILFTLSMILSISFVTPAFADHIYAGPEVEKVITYDENGRKVITLIFDPAKTPDYIKENTYEQQENEKEEQKQEHERIAPLTEPPEVGTTLAHILDENADPDVKGWKKFMPPYQSGMAGQCVWYARGRFKEVYGIDIPHLDGIKNWIANAYQCDKIKAVTDLSDVPIQSVAVFRPIEDNEDKPGHVCFVEYVERDNEGKPLNIYYTDANGAGDLRKNEFDDGYDGTVKVKSFEDFKNTGKLKLIGFIVPSE